MACSGPLWLPGDCAPYGTSPPGGCRAEVHLAHPLGGQGLELPQVPRIAHFLITPGPPTDRRAVPVQDELAPLLMSVRFPVCLEDGLHLLSPENVGFFESVTKPSGFVVETLPWFLVPVLVSDDRRQGGTPFGMFISKTAPSSFLNSTASTEIYTLSPHAALPTDRLVCEAQA